MATKLKTSAARMKSSLTEQKMNRTSTPINKSGKMSRTSTPINAQAAQNKFHTKMQKTSAALSKAAGTSTAKKVGAPGTSSARIPSKIASRAAKVASSITPKSGTGMMKKTKTPIKKKY